MAANPGSGHLLKSKFTQTLIINIALSDSNNGVGVFINFNVGGFH
jgi:hypothetical protein